MGGSESKGKTVCDLKKAEALAVKAPNVDDLPSEVLAVVGDDSASHWLRCNLFEAIARRDPLDALNDAQALTTALEAWAKHVFRVHGLELPV